MNSRAKQLSDADLVAVMTLRSHEKALGRKDPGAAAGSAAEVDDSETGSVASTSTKSTAEATGSPAKPKKKPRTS